ncbi:MAG TPA: DddA-like double-stranded DNA deaminase toxin [Actinophytocola sp.]|uniref:DddA-like double-stranded DNA deaminase toxin n=1 Tax=Actinophytocola sp. TaxID=1872138 RepID=UPI002DDD7F90|nr:DddA-like double-stranded DNA deaminase toxin [Actinophytocola sp.]HEV2782125.1 DddA-like double-stranded DNA deaminase toxin [Actinophytocola sp.]
MRLLITAAGLAVALIAVLLLLNWWMVSCGRLACDIKPAWAAAEASTPDSCPPNLKAAASDAVWARGVYDNLPAWRPADPATHRPADKTTGWFFAEGFSTRKLISGEGSKAEPDPLWQEAVNLLGAAQGVAHPPNPRAPHPAASHSETKAAVWMRQNKITYAVAVINNTRGPCGQEAPQDYPCTAAIPAILPVGSTMVVWWWAAQDGHMTSATYEGTAR